MLQEVAVKAKAAKTVVKAFPVAALKAQLFKLFTEFFASCCSSLDDCIKI